VAKAEWGLKRTCLSCNAKFYDMNRSPILCPKCGAAFDPEALAKARRTRVVAPPARAAAAEAEDEEVAVEADEKEEEEGVMEDTSELGGDSDDVDDVVDGSDGPREDR
jgi:uncharacterized protein (TIGR02300 family)